MAHFQYKPRKMNKRSVLPRFLALWLTLGLSVPNPASALRTLEPAQSGMEEELESALRADTQDDRTRSAPAAGMEEAKRGFISEDQIRVIRQAVGWYQYPVWLDGVEVPRGTPDQVVGEVIKRLGGRITNMELDGSVLKISSAKATTAGGLEEMRAPREVPFPGETGESRGERQKPPYDPTIRDGTSRRHPLDLGREGRHRPTEEQARFIRDFIRDRILAIGRANRDRTMKSYLRFLVGLRQGRPQEEADRIALGRIREKVRVDTHDYLGGFGTASTDGTERFSLAEELLRDAREAVSEGRIDADAVERLTEVLFHEVNHVLDGRYRRLQRWFQRIEDPAAWPSLPLDPESLKAHLAEFSAIGRTANVMEGIYVPDDDQPLGGAFVYRYRNAGEGERKVESFDTAQFPFEQYRLDVIYEAVRLYGPETPMAMASSAVSTPTFFVRFNQMRFFVSSVSYSTTLGRK